MDWFKIEFKSGAELLVQAAYVGPTEHGPAIVINGETLATLAVHPVSITRVKGPSEPSPVEAWSPHSIESRVDRLEHEMAGPGGVVYGLRKRLTELDGRVTTQQAAWGGRPPDACVLDRLDALERAPAEPVQVIIDQSTVGKPAASFCTVHESGADGVMVEVDYMASRGGENG